MFTKLPTIILRQRDGIHKILYNNLSHYYGRAALTKQGQLKKALYFIIPIQNTNRKKFVRIFVNKDSGSLNYLKDKFVSFIRKHPDPNDDISFVHTDPGCYLRNLLQGNVCLIA
jgi:hypothetical protein